MLSDSLPLFHQAGSSLAKPTGQRNPGVIQTQIGEIPPLPPPKPCLGNNSYPSVFATFLIKHYF